MASHFSVNVYMNTKLYKCKAEDIGRKDCSMIANKPMAKSRGRVSILRYSSITAGKAWPAVDKGGMAMAEIREKAVAMGITPGKMKKEELILTIQIAEGNTPCFGMSNGQDRKSVV